MGTAASAYQIEGRDTNDGKGDHIWNIYEREPGHIYENQTGDIACDHIHRFKEDVAIMKKMGLKAYRFFNGLVTSLPEGTGRVNETGVKILQRLN